MIILPGFPPIDGPGRPSDVSIFFQSLMMTTSPFNTVMLIDDNPIDSFIHTRLFQLYHFSERNLVYDNCLSALEYLTEHQYTIEKLPELIVLDLHLPGMNGLEFLSAFDSLSELVKSYCQIVV